MDKIKVGVKLLHSDAKLPLYATEHAAGCDFYVVEDVSLAPGETTKVPTGISVEVPSGYYLKIESRSGLAVKGIHHVAGIIDSDYRGEIFVLLHNSGKEEYKIEKGDRIAQGIVRSIVQSDFHELDELSDTGRGEGGFHSTGKK